MPSPVSTAALRQRAPRLAEAAVERLRGATAGARELSAALEDHVGRFCVGLARQPYHIQHGLGW